MKINNTTYINIALCLFLLFNSGCTNEGEIVPKDNDTMTNQVLKGNFVSEGQHSTSGLASINEERTELSFINFKTVNGPLLEVWLSTSRAPTTPDTYISLGILQGISGNFIYDLPSNIDYFKYDHVVIWCVQASVSFGYAIVE